MARTRYWTVPRLWPDRDVYIIGGGPSLLKNDLSLIHDERVIGVNDAYTLGTWVDICWFGDWEWFKTHREALAHFPGLIATHQAHCKEMKSVRTVQFREEGLCEDPRYIARNRNSGASAINLAYHLGAKRVILLGFDLHIKKDKETGKRRTNWHDNNRGKPNAHSYEIMLKCFAKVAADAKRLNFEIINATPGSAMTFFPIMTLEEAMK